MSTIKVSSIQTPAGVDQYLCKAWVNFNGVGTVAIRAAGNVSSITDNGVGDYTINFASPMVDANYSLVGTSLAGASAAVGTPAGPLTFTTTSARFTTRATNNGALQDLEHQCIAIFR